MSNGDRFPTKTYFLWCCIFFLKMYLRSSSTETTKSVRDKFAKDELDGIAIEYTTPHTQK